MFPRENRQKFINIDYTEKTFYKLQILEVYDLDYSLLD